MIYKYYSIYLGFHELKGVFGFRREGYAGHYVAGQAPPLSDEPNVEHLDVDYSYFDNTVFPNISHRVPSIKNPKVIGRFGPNYVFSG